MNTEEINAELKLLELVLSSEYNALSGVHQSNGAYYFITTTKACYKVGVFLSKWRHEVLDYEFKWVNLHRVEDIRDTNGSYVIRTPYFTDVLHTLVACGYEPTKEDLFNITTEEVGDSETVYIRERVKVAAINFPEDVEDELDTIHSSAERTQEYIDSLVLIRDEWETVADKLHSIIADYLSQEDFTKEDLQYDLDQITFHHLLKRENTSDKQ